MILSRFAPVALITMLAVMMSAPDGHASMDEGDGQIQMWIDGRTVRLLHPYGYCNLDEQKQPDSALVDQAKESFDILADDYLALIYDCYDLEAFHAKPDHLPGGLLAYGVPKADGLVSRRVKMNVEQFKEHLRGSGFHENTRRMLEAKAKQVGLKGAFHYFGEIDFDLDGTYSAIVVGSDLTVIGMTVVNGMVIKIVRNEQMPQNLEGLERVLTILGDVKYITQELRRINAK